MRQPAGRAGRLAAEDITGCGGSPRRRLAREAGLRPPVWDSAATEHPAKRPWSSKTGVAAEEALAGRARRHERQHADAQQASACADLDPGRDRRIPRTHAPVVSATDRRAAKPGTPAPAALALAVGAGRRRLQPAPAEVVRRSWRRDCRERAGMARRLPLPLSSARWRGPVDVRVAVHRCAARSWSRGMPGRHDRAHMTGMYLVPRHGPPRSMSSRRRRSAPPRRKTPAGTRPVACTTGPVGLPENIATRH
jgi:hypothetical protein